MPKPLKFHTPPALAAAIMIALIALLAAGSLLLLFRLYSRFAQSSATASVIQYGTMLAQRVAAEPFMSAAPNSLPEIDQFRQLTMSIYKLEPSLEYVTVQDDDLVLYHWQAPLNDSRAESIGTDIKVAAGPRRIQLGDHAEDVLDFTCSTPGSDGVERRLRIGLNQDVLEQTVGADSPALDVMMRVTILTVAVAFALCLLAVSALVWRELRWIKRRADSEHLAFAGAVAGSVIHDFRNPMSAMRLDAQLLGREVGRGATADPAKVSVLAGRIARTLERMDEMLREFLALSSPSRAEPGVVDVNAAISDCADLMKLRFERASVKLELKMLAVRPAAIGFPLQFKRAVLNILNNSIHFALAGSSVIVEITGNTRYTQILVSDQGPGIPKEERRKAFDMFYSRRPGGTGIGLALARTAIMNCGGHIRVLDGPDGSGCVIEIRLPAASLTSAPHPTRSNV